MTDQYAVIGNPISHSQSPLIHSEFAKQTGQNIVYDRLSAPLDGFDRVASAFVGQGGKGLNITLPFKGDAFRLAHQLTSRASVCEAVNTLTFKDGVIYGDNTDGVGLVRDIVENLDMPIAGKRVLLLGAGGAVRGVLLPLLEEKPASLTVANRTVEKAQALASQFAPYGAVRAVGYPDLMGEQFDIIINGPSPSLHDELPPIPHGVFAPDALAYDMVYSAGLTPFLKRAQQEKAGMLADGLGMLVEQAAESFFIWRGVKPETRRVMAILREVLN